MRYIELLASYLPSLVVEEILQLEEEENQTGVKHDATKPRLATYDAACLFADVSGFTKLSESMSIQYGPHAGAEHLAKQLNSYFSQLVKIINSEGGDVFKFAGDAMIVLWPPTSDEESIGDRARRATQSAVRIQGLGQGLAFDDDSVSLSIKIGVGVGSLAILHLGGVKGRTEYIAVGEPMSQAFAAEGMASAGEVIASPPAWKQISKFFKGIKMPSPKRARHGSFVRIDLDSVTATGRARNKQFGLNLFDSYTGLTERRIRQLIPAAALQSIDSEHPEFEYFSSELRHVSVVFISLGLSESEVQEAAKGGDEMLVLHEAMRIVQTSAYKYEGALNKFIVDDKGATIIVLFGLPPYSHENDAKRAVSSSLHAATELREKLNMNPAVGITSGTAFCGVLGSQTRKEYSVLGDIVNLSARLMGAAIVSMKSEGGSTIICDEATYITCSRDIPFRALAPVKVKGKAAPIVVFEPLTSLDALAYSSANRKGEAIEKKKKNRGTLLGHAITRSSSKARSDSTASNLVHAPTMHLLGPRFPIKGQAATAAMLAHSSERFISFDILGTTRLLEIEETSEQKNENLRMYFRVPNTLLGARSGAQRRKPHNSLGRVHQRSSQRLKALFSGSKSKAARKGTVQEVLDSDSQGDSLDGEFAYELHSTPSNHTSSGQSSYGPRSTSPRKSLIFYNNANRTSSHLSTSGEKVDPEYLITCSQVAVGAGDLYCVASVDRHDQGQDETKSLLRNVTEYCKNVGLMRHGVSTSDVALMIQGTEVVLNMDIWATNRERIDSLGEGTDAPRPEAMGVPFKYLEAVVNEALGFGEIWNSTIELVPTKGLKSHDDPSLRKVPSLGGSNASVYNDMSGNGGTTLKLVAVPRKDVEVIQSASSFVLQSLMARKIELVECGKGSVVVISGEPGSGKTHMLKRFGYGFLPNSVPVLGSSEQWEHTTSQFEQLFESENGTAQFLKFRNAERNYHVWFDIISQWIFFEASSLAKSTLRKNPSKVRTQILQGVLDENLIEYASLLNEDLGTNFAPPSGDAAQALEKLAPAQYKAHINDLISDMICDIISKVTIKFGGLIILFDDALRLDEHSWRIASKLASLVCSDALELMLVIALRPFEGYADRTMGLRPRLVESRTRNALPAFREMCSIDGVDILALGPLSRAMAIDIFRKNVGENIEVISADLWQVCEPRCFNNPLLIKEFAHEIREARKPKLVRFTPISSGKKQVRRGAGGYDPNLKYMASLRIAVQHLDEPAWTLHAAHRAALSKQAAFLNAAGNDGSGGTANHSSAGTDGINEDEMETMKFPADYYPPTEVAPPRTAAGVLGEIVDRLGSIEQMVLRIACMIGTTFSLRLIQDVYPQNSLHKDYTAALVKAACENLADQHGIVHKIRANAFNDEYVYRFADTLLVSTLRHRLLKRHKLSLAASITRARNQFKAALELEKLQKEDKAYLQPRPASLMLRQSSDPRQTRVEKEGFLSIRKQSPAGGNKKIFSDWKERFVILRQDCMLLFKKRDPRRMTAVDAHVVIYLNDATVEMVQDTSDRVHSLAFKVKTEEWSRRGEMHFTYKDFTFAEADDTETRRWFSRVSMTLNRHKLGARFVGARNSLTSSINELLPVRRRTKCDFGEVLTDEESGLIITLRGVSHTLGDRLPSLTSSKPGSGHLAASANNPMTEIYASAFINIYNGTRLVRKQTMLTAPVHSELLEFNESFVFKLAPELLVDWASQPLRNSKLEIVLWRQADTALGFDIMLGYCAVQLADVYARRIVSPRLDMDLHIHEPYAEVQTQHTIFSVGLQLIVRDADEEYIEQMQETVASSPKASEDSSLSEQREIADDMFQDNMEMNMRNETGTRGGSFVDPTGAGRGETLKRQPKKKKPIKSMRIDLSQKVPEIESPVVLQEPLQRSSTLTRTRSRIASSTAVPSSRRGTLTTDANKGPLAAPLAHLDFVAKAARTRGERDLLGVLKRLLLTRSFAELVSPVSLDEKSRRWLGSQFTRAEVRRQSVDDALAGAARRLSMASIGSTAEDVVFPDDQDSPEFLANAYIQACARLISYTDEESSVEVGPVPLGAVLAHVGKGISLMTLVRVHRTEEEMANIIPEEGEDDTSDEDNNVDRGAVDELPLATYVDELRTQALEAARAAVDQRVQGDGPSERGTSEIALGRSASSSALLGHTRNNSMASSSAATMAAVAAAATARKRFSVKRPAIMKKKTDSWNSVVTRYHKFVNKQKLEDPRELDPGSWYFNLQMVPLEMRTSLVSFMFRTMGADSKFSVPADRLVAFVERVEAGMTMHHNPYHNYDHACDVLQGTFCMLTTMRGCEFLDDLHAFALTIAAFCHDLEHPGLNNAFQVKAKTELAMLYEGRSVLESHHCACTFSMFESNTTNILCNLDEASVTRVRQIVLDCILATDMTCHFDLTGELRDCIVRHMDEPTSSMNIEERSLIAKSILHCSDISNPTRSWACSKRWQDLVCEEFYAQGDLERANGWEVSPNMDRDTTSQAEMSINFIDFIVAPLFFAMSTLLPNSSDPCIQIATNRDNWMRLLEDEVYTREGLNDEAREEIMKDWAVREATFEQVLASAGFAIGKDGKVRTDSDPSSDHGTISHRKGSNAAVAFMDATDVAAIQRNAARSISASVDRPDSPQPSL